MSEKTDAQGTLLNFPQIQQPLLLLLNNTILSFYLEEIL